MARAWNKLSANFVRSVSKRGRYADGGNLQLQIAKGGTKAWIFAYQRNGVIRSMGLGSARSVPLALARELAGEDGDPGLPFGMYAEVETPGVARLGDTVEPL
jgi:hypothetical protein